VFTKVVVISFAGVLLLGLAAGAALLVGAGSTPGAAQAAVSPAPSAAGAAGTSEALLVARRAGARDDLVRLTDQTSQTIGALPGRAVRAVAAPDGRAVAYLPMKWGPRFWVATPSGEVRTVSLASLGVTFVDAVTWTSPTQLIVSAGKQRREPNPAKDYLYEVTAGSWTVKRFRGLRGAEPSAAPEAGKLAFVRISDVGPAADRPWARKLREQLLLLDLNGGGAPKVIETETSSSTLDLRSFFEPQLAPDGEHVVTSTAGSDITVNYRVWSVHGGKAIYHKRTACQGPANGVWDAAGARLAFAGLVPMPDTDMQGRVWVYDLGTGTVAASDLLGSFTSIGLSWSASGDLALSLSKLGDALDEGTAHLAVGGSLTPLTKLQAGGLPAWVK
jgi:hypothetical protein